MLVVMLECWCLFIWCLVPFIVDEVGFWCSGAVRAHGSAGHWELQRGKTRSNMRGRVTGWKLE